jgi:hypothetical protein
MTTAFYIGVCNHAHHRLGGPFALFNCQLINSIYRFIPPYYYLELSLRGAS